MKWKLYIIETQEGPLYTGITTNLERRFTEHKSKIKGASFFNIYSPKKIVYIEKFENRSQASKREYEIKKMSRIEKLDLISSQRKQCNSF